LDTRIEHQFEKQPYLRMLAYTDAQIGKFIQFLKENGLYEDTAFVILGDHPLRGVSITSKEQRYHVPFALVAPGVLEPNRIHTVAGQADILPTLVDLFHIRAPYSAMGKSLLAAPDKDWTFVSQSGRDFAFVTDKGFVPVDQPDEKHRDMVALNKAVYTVLKNNTWVQK
jgi:phosphoglycerol transferase MdoB-like AlkP superfamily enzyme